MTRDGKTYYYHYNAHGDTIALTDDSGNIAARYAYDIWSNIISKEGDIDNPFTYGGQWGYIHDDESGLYFLKTRYYDPSIGRFISRDRFAGFENDPDSQNKYVYCNNDPVNNVDRSELYEFYLSSRGIDVLVAELNAAAALYAGIVAALGLASFVAAGIGGMLAVQLSFFMALGVVASPALTNLYFIA